MKIHRLTPDGFGVIKKNLFEKCLGTAFMLVFVTTGVSLFLFSLKPVTTVCLISGIVIFIASFYFMMLSIHRKDSLSFQVELCEASIKRKLGQLPDVEISRDEVREIRETVGSGLLIITDDCYRYIFVPVIVENYNDIRNTLRGWKDIDTVPAPKRQLVPFMLSAAVSISFMTTVMAESRRTFISSGILLVLILLYTLYQLHCIPKEESRAKRKRFVGYSLVLSSSVLVLRILDEYYLW